MKRGKKQKWFLCGVCSGRPYDNKIMEYIQLDLTVECRPIVGMLELARHMRVTAASK
jgi:hypothetical protein